MELLVEGSMTEIFLHRKKSFLANTQNT